jgi:hypothetical protein
MKKLILILLIGVVGIAINWLSLLLGWWPITLLVGLAIGLVVRRGCAAFLVMCCVGGLSWGLPLAVLAINSPVGPVSMAIESIVGLKALHGAVIVLTVVLGCLLSMAGGWMGIASRQLSAAFALTPRRDYP